MKRFVETIKNIWGIAELKDKILTTLGLLLIYRIGSTVLLPGIDPESLTQLQAQTSEGLLGVLDAFTGGAFSRASVMALGIQCQFSEKGAALDFWIIAHQQQLKKPSQILV